MKLKLLKRLVATTVCAVFVSMSVLVVSVGAVDEHELNKIREDINRCTKTIQDLNQKKTKINEDKEAKTKKLNDEIQSNEEFLIGIDGLMASGEDHKEEYDLLRHNIEENKQKIIQIDNDYQEELRKVDEMLQQTNSQKGILEANLQKLINEQNASNMPQPNNENQLKNQEQDCLDLWTKISSGSQYDIQNRYSALCWLMSSMNQVNFFDKIKNGDKSFLIRSLEQAVDHYKKTKGNEAFLNNQGQPSEAIVAYLNLQGIKTLNVTDALPVNYPINSDENAKKIAEEETGKKLTEIFTEQIKTHFNNNKNASPVSVLVCGHWVTIVDYFDNTKNVVIVDSANGVEDTSKIYVENIERFILDKVKPMQSGNEKYFSVDLVFTSTNSNLDIDNSALTDTNMSDINRIKNEIEKFV